jgi:holo-[acyl-carrier protein] synthase
MIEGTGTDLVDIRRIEKVMQRFGERFENRVFTKKERQAAADIKDEKKRISFYAKRFAAKEAYAKAIGKGIGKDISFKEIGVVNKESGQPVIELSEHEKSNIFLSLSDEYPYAQAFVVISKG